jgi:uncharacterized protein
MPARTGRRRVLVSVVGVLTAIVLIVGLLWGFQRRLIYLPDPSAPPPAQDVVPNAVDVRLRTADGLDLAAWYLAAPPSSCRATVLIAPGNAGNRELRAPLMDVLAARGFGVLVLEYRGYGGNPGSPTEEGLAADAVAAREFLAAQGLAESEILYYGESLGAGVVTTLAVSHPPAGLVLRSPFVDLAAAAAVHYPFLPVRAMLWDDYPVRDTVARLIVPVTVVYGETDAIIPPEQSREVAAAAGERGVAVAVPGADHNDPALLDGPELLDAVVALADRASCPPPPP